MPKYTFQEFFAGGGMVRQALGEAWLCTFANDFDGKKALTYQRNWGTGGELFVGDIRDVNPQIISGDIDLSWASFPCQDLSLAGTGHGLRGKRSSMFHVFWQKLVRASVFGPMPKIVVIENVCGLLTSNNGKDFSEVTTTFIKNGYNVGALVLDAKDFVPQSRKRVFIIGVRKDLSIDPSLDARAPLKYCHPKSLLKAYEHLSPKIQNNWIWFNIHKPEGRKANLIDILDHPSACDWDNRSKTISILSKMSAINLKKVEAAKCLGSPTVGGLFMRTRKTDRGKQVFAEVRFDGISGCLRTPNGGSSRQSILYVHGNKILSRLINPRETARLMGLPETYILPKSKNEALHLTGDGVAVPVVEHLRTCLFENILASDDRSTVEIDNLFLRAQ